MNVEIRIWEIYVTHPVKTLLMAKNQKETSASSILLLLSEKIGCFHTEEAHRGAKKKKKNFKVISKKL